MQLPPLQVTRAVIQRYARLLVRYGSELGKRPLVLPTSEFFPDRFDQDEPSLQRLVERMQAHAGLSDIPIEAVVIPRDADGAAATGSCSSGACAVPTNAQTGIPRLVDLEDSWRLQVPEAELSHSIALTTNLSRSLAFVFLVETQLEDEVIEPPVDVTADFVAVGLGLGALMMQGAYVYTKSCGGPSVASVTKVGLDELSVAFALFIATGNHSFRGAHRALETTQQSLLEEARHLIESNRSLVNLLANNPSRVARGDFELEESFGWLGRFFAKRRKSAGTSSPLDGDLSLDELESMLIAMPHADRTARRRNASNPQRDELKDLVSQALSERAVSDG